MKLTKKLFKTSIISLIVVAAILVPVIITPLLDLTVPKDANALGVSSIYPDKGVVEGGEEVLIEGADFLEAKVTIQKIASNGSTAYAIDDENKLYVWGWDNFGQAGDGDKTDNHGLCRASDTETACVLSPIELTNLDTGTTYVNELYGKKIIDVAAGHYGAIALDIDGNVYTWGWDQYGQIGDGTSTKNHYIVAGQPDNYDCVLAPVKITDMSLTGGYSNALSGVKITKVAAGSYHFMALDGQGNLYIWGSDGWYQIGNGNSTINQMTLSNGHNLVIAPIKLTGMVTGSYNNAIKDVKIVDVAAGSYHTLAVDTSGNLYAWGEDTKGEVGDGDKTLNHVNRSDGTWVIAPVILSTIGSGATYTNMLYGRKVVSVSASYSLSSAIDENGNLYMWGWNTFGQTGIGNSTQNVIVSIEYSSYVISPVDITSVDVGSNLVNELYGKSIADIKLGYGVALALDSQGNIYSWGQNHIRQTGVGDSTKNSARCAWSSSTIDCVKAPVNLSSIYNNSSSNVLNSIKVSSIAFGDSTAYVLDDDGNIYGWGAGARGALGDGDSSDGHETCTESTWVSASWDCVKSPINISRAKSSTNYVNALYSPEKLVSVFLGSAECVDVKILSDTRLTCKTTAHVKGKVDVVLSSRLNTVSLTNGFTYLKLEAPNTGMML